jgi:hypothetical protein
MAIVFNVPEGSVSPSAIVGDLVPSEPFKSHSNNVWGMGTRGGQSIQVRDVFVGVLRLYQWPSAYAMNLVMSL